MGVQHRTFDLCAYVSLFEDQISAGILIVFTGKGCLIVF